MKTLEKIKTRRITKWDNHWKPIIYIEIKEDDYKDLLSEIEKLRKRSMDDELHKNKG